MKKIREIRKYAGVYVIKLTPTDLQDLDLQVGDEVDISDIQIIKKEVEK